MFILSAIFDMFRLFNNFIVMIGNGFAAVGIIGWLVGFFTDLFTR